MNNRDVKSVLWENNKLYILDQTKLPVDIEIEEQTSVEQVWDSIKKLKVRGAPAIGVAGAYGLVIAMRDYTSVSTEIFLKKLKENAAYLDSSRPTAVNLSWALKKVVQSVERSSCKNSSEMFETVLIAARNIHEEDIQLCQKIGEFGVDLIKNGMGILTHCNAGRLATSDYGTATAPMYLAHQRGVKFSVYSDESRPLLQGSRLTAWELQQAGIDVYTITDNMAAFIMSKGLIQLVIVGADRVAANGDAANKIGTMGVAILAKHFNIPFYIACPHSTIDLATQKGDDITIEERDPEEVTHFGLRRTAPVGIKVRNPAFDVTPNELISGFITDRGIIKPPYIDSLKTVFGS